jgi:glycosyltransferase involved in cell wall biosynthesis
MKNNPMVAIIIPTFNRAELLKDALESVRAQTCEDWECLVIDDHSTDNTKELVFDFIANDNRFKYLIRDREPKGAPTCRNIGIEKADSKYIIFLDSDDLLAPWCLEKRIGFFEQHPELDFILSASMDFNDKVGDMQTLRTDFEHPDPLTLFLSFQSAWQTTSPTWRLDSIRGKIKWREEMLSWQDAVFHIEALLAKLKYEWIDDIPDNFIRTHDNQRITASGYNIDLIVNRVFVYKTVLELLKGNKAIQGLFGDNVLSYLCNTAEKIDGRQDLDQFLVALKQSLLLTDKAYRKLGNYLKLNHRLRNVVLLRGIVYRLRSLLIKRGSFFKPKRIGEKELIQLKQKLEKHNSFCF